MANSAERLEALRARIAQRLAHHRAGLAEWSQALTPDYPVMVRHRTAIDELEALAAILEDRAC